MFGAHALTLGRRFSVQLVGMRGAHKRRRLRARLHPVHNQFNTFLCLPSSRRHQGIKASKFTRLQTHSRVHTVKQKAHTKYMPSCRAANPASPCGLVAALVRAHQRWQSYRTRVRAEFHRLSAWYSFAPSCVCSARPVCLFRTRFGLLCVLACQPGYARCCVRVYVLLVMKTTELK